MKYFFPIILSLTGISVQSCIDCGPQAELSARIFFTADSLKLDSVYALNAVSQKAIRQQTDNFAPQHYYSLSLPISLVSDTTTYVFRFTERVDTLSIYYQRIFRTKSGCGFITDAQKPATGKGYHSTFSKTDIHYETYVNPDVQPWSNAEPGAGISIRIQP